MIVRTGPITNLQILRFVAAFVVVIAHALDVVVVAGFALPDPVENVGAVGVDIFFVISGFIITRTGFMGRTVTAARFAINRLRRVVPLYYLLSLPWLAISLIDGTFWIRRLIATITFSPAVGNRVINPMLEIGWTLCFEMLFYAAATLLLLVRKPWAFALIALAYAGFWIARYATGLAIFRFIGNPIVLEFAFGIAIALCAGRIGTRIGLAALIAGMAGLIASVVLDYGQISESQFTTDGTLSLMRVLIWGAPSALLVLAAVTMPPWTRGRFQTFLVTLGDASYSTYLIHPLWLFALAAAMPHLIAISPVLLLLIGIVGATLCGLLVHFRLELPLLRVLGARGEKGAGQPGPSPSNARIPG